MKDLQNRIQQMLADRKNHIRVISMVTALSLLVMFIAPMLLVSPGISLTKNSYSPVKLGNTIARAYDGNILINTPINNSYKPEGESADANYGGKTEVHDNAYSPASVSLKTLLFGDGTGTNWLKGNETLDQALAKAEDEYFLGLASDFCAFINEDFTAYDADAEGRMAVGGDLSFNNNWNYQIGSGDYATVTPLTETDEYSGEYNQRYGFAHVLCGGTLYRVNTISTGNKAYNQNHPDWHYKNGEYVDTVVYDPEHDMYKKLFVDTVSGSKCWGPDGDQDGNQDYSNSFSSEYPGDDAGNCNHDYLRSVNQLAQIYNSDTIKVKDIIQKVYEDIKKRSSLLSKIKGIAGHVDGNTVIFDGEGAEGNTVYFTLDKWGEDYNGPNINRVEFRNIPENANIVVNVGGKNFNIFGMNGDNRIVKTFINGNEISQRDGDISTNNSQESGRILYNFYEATEGKIQCNFNGTVLSPKADVTTPAAPGDHPCPGHLSGALIANSHWGYIEFGYRPYRGGSEILGLTSGYVVPVDKFIEGTDNKYLPGARFTIEKIEDGVTSTVGGWVSGDSTKYAPLPFKVDFSGDTDYSAVKTYLDDQAESNGPQSKNNISHFSKKALVDALGGGFKADEDDDAETTTVETEETTSADTATIETETTAAETTAAEETTAITTAADETTSSETETTEVAETTVSEVTEPVTEAEVQDETDIPDEETEVTDEELADVQNIQNFEILADDDQSETDPSETPETPETPETTPANVFQSQFTIKESNPPEGFFRTDKQYTVDITETINDVIEKDGKYYPDIVDVDVTIRDGDNPYYHSSFNITDNRNALDMVENRVITIDDVQFTLTIEDHKATAVKVGNEDIPLPADKVFTHNNKHYYFDPEYMMVIPLPEENLKFENKPGLYFKKVDDNRNPVTGAEITLYPMISDWEQGDLIKLSDIAPETVYTFTEEVVPPGYEQAEPIHFKKTDEHTIEYWSGETGNHTPHDLRVPGNQIIEMVDQRILGAKLKIFKYRQTAENEPEVQLTGAKFSLYAEDGTLLKSNIDADNDQINLTEITDTTYAENGYLKPGTYYLKETKTPTVESNEDPYEYPGKLYFVVNNDFTVKAYTAPQPLSYESDDHHIWILDADGKRLDNEGNSEHGKIENVVSFLIRTDASFEQFYATGAVNSVNQNVTEVGHTYNPPIALDNCKIQCWKKSPPNITYAEIQTADGTRYVYEATPDPNSAITASNLLSEGTTDNGVQTLKVKNEKQGENKAVTVTKKWKNDEGFEGLRSDVTVQLYRSTVELEESDIAAELAKTNGSKLTPYTVNGSEVTAILNSANNWTHKWENLPAHSGEDNKVFYYYYVKEISTHSDYETTYQVEGNDLTVVNTLNTINIKAEKHWDYLNGTIELPPSITFMLQMYDGSKWVDVPEKKITLTADDSWMGEFKNLPDGKQYRMKEVNVPTGWYISVDSNETAQNNATLSITNKADLSRLDLHKDWDEEGSGSVESVKVELYRKEQSLWPENQSAEDVMKDYARLLQYSLYFYDGVMCGDQVDGTSNYTWRSDCHTEDEVKGGFHDAGDHVMFGLPAGFSASTLGWSLKEYRNEFDSLGQTPHIKMIIDHYAEFFNNAVRYNADGTVKEILVQKGHGNTDHAYWGMPEGQPSREDQMYWKSDTGSDVAAEYAAALALAYINFHNTDETKYSEYLETAKKLYEYSRRVDKALNEENINIDETDKNQYPGYYKSNQYADDQAWAASWIAVADSEAEYNGTSYKVEAQSRLTSDDINGWDWGGYHWNNVRHGAEFVLAAYLGESWDNVKNFVNSKGSDWKGDRYKYPDEWGASRYNSGFQTVALAAVHQAETKSNVDISRAEIADWCKSQMNYILGDNKYNMCFVTAFSDHSPLKVHFRAGSGAVYNMQTKDDPNIIDKAYTNDVNRLIGGMVGGSAGDSDNYEDRRTFYQRNEVASDYNAVLVGAAAGLYSYFRTGATYEIPGVKNQYLPAASTSQEGQTEGTANAVNPAASMANAGKAVATTVRKLYKTGVDTNIAASTGTKTRALRLGKAEKLAGSLDSIAGVIGPRLMGTLIDGSDDGFPIEGKYKGGQDFQPYLSGTWIDKYVAISVEDVSKIVLVFDSIPDGDGGQIAINGDWNHLTWKNYTGTNYFVIWKSDDSIDINNVQIQARISNGAAIKSIRFYNDSQSKINVKSSSDYITMNGTVDIITDSSGQIINRNVFNNSGENKTECFEFDDNNNLKVRDAPAGIYTVELTDSNGAKGTCKIEVLENGLLYKMVNVNAIEYNSSVPTDIKDFDIQRVAVKFSKKWSNDGANYGYYLNGNAVNSENNETGKSVYAHTVDDRLIYDITVPNKPLKTVSIKHWWDDSQINIDKFYYIYSIGDAIKLSTDKADALTGEAVALTPTGNIEGLTYTITKNGDVYNNNVINNNVFTPTEHGTYEITAANSADNTSTVTITVKDFALVSHDVNVKAGNTVNIPITYNGENNFTFDPAESEYFDIRVDDNDNVVVRGKQATAGPIQVQISRNGYSETVNVNVNNGISINGDKNEIAINEAIQLEAENAVGSVTWTSSDPAIATVDGNGKVIGKGFGTVTITATDDDGEATYQIRVEPIPKDAEKVDTITIEESQNWTAEVNNLPKVSPNGIPYVYYIKEVDSNQYITLSYTGNGTKLDGNNVPTITVTNKLTKNLPITGGRGTEKIYMAGGVMMLLAAAAYAMFKRREFGKEE